MGTRNLLVMNNILFYVEVNKEIHTGSEQLEAEQMMTVFLWLGDLSQ